MNENNLMLFLLLVISFFFLSIFFIVTLVLTYKKIKRLQKLENYACVLAANSNTISHQTDPTRLAQTLLLEILPFKSAKWGRFSSRKNLQNPNSNGSGPSKKPGSVEEKADRNGLAQEKETGTGGVGSGQVVVVEEEEEEKRVKKKNKKKGKKKKRVDLKGEENGGGRENSEPGLGIPELGCLCPFTSMGSATQRKIKKLYQLVQSYESNKFTLTQVGEFTKCLAQAREELEDKAEAIKRKFSIKKALLSKADRSSIDRLRQQIYNLENQQKRLEEDVCVYNWLQDQLQLSPACRKMVEVCADLELKTKTSKRLESTETDEFADISFEELLAQEKKDSFWQKNWKSRMCTR